MEISTCSNNYWLKGIFRDSVKFLSLPFLLLSLLITTNVHAQPATCTSFTVDPSRTVEGGNTIFTFKVTETVSTNDLSHWGFVFDVCTGTEQQFVDAATAQTSTSADGPWSDITISYQDDPSEDCINENVIKFNQNMTGETVRYYRLIVPGDVNIEIGLAYIKFGNGCCVIDLNFGSCCPPLSVYDPADQEVCAGEWTTAVTFSGTAGATFEWTNDNTSIGLAASGTGNIASFQAINNGSTPQVANITVTPTKDNCRGTSQTFTITVNPKPSVDAGYYGPVCQDAPDIALGGTPAGGVWTGTGVSGNQTDGYKFDPSVGTQTLTYTYTNGNGCSGSDQATITVRPSPYVDAGNYGPVCKDAPKITLVGSPAGGVWTGTGVSYYNGVYKFNPSYGTQTLKYTYTDGYGCTGKDYTTIVVNNKPYVDPGKYGPLCDDGPKITLYGTPAGGVWSGAGVSYYNGVYKFNPAYGTQTIKYTYTDRNGCTNSAWVCITVIHCFEGCSPGYYKNHYEAWCNGTPGTYFFTKFSGITNKRGLPASTTMAQAINFGGGGYYQLARQAVAALQNACHNAVDYPYTTTQILTAVRNIFNYGYTTLGGKNYGSVDALKNELDRANNLGCPLNNSNAVPTYRTNSVLDESTATTMITKLNVDAYPNPYTDVIRFVIQSPVSGEANLQVSNMLGQKIATVYKGRINANSSQVIEFKIPTPAPQAVIYTLTIGEERVVGKLMKANKP